MREFLIFGLNDKKKEFISLYEKDGDALIFIEAVNKENIEYKERLLERLNRYSQNSEIYINGEAIHQPIISPSVSKIYDSYVDSLDDSLDSQHNDTVRNQLAELFSNDIYKKERYWKECY